MKRKTTRLTFTEEELANPKVRRAAKRRPVPPTEHAI